MFEFLKSKPKEDVSNKETSYEDEEDSELNDEMCICNLDVTVTKGGVIRCDFFDADGNQLRYDHPDRIVLSLQASIENFLHVELNKALDLTDEQVEIWNKNTEHLVREKDDLPATHAYQTVIKETDYTTFGREFG